MADTRDYLMNVDAVGSDFGLYPIHELRQGTTHADQEARQRRADDAQPGPAGRRLGPCARCSRRWWPRGVLLLGAAPASPPEHPANFI